MYDTMSTLLKDKLQSQFGVTTHTKPQPTTTNCLLN